MDGNTTLFVLIVALYALWQMTRIASAVQSVATELRALRNIAEQNRR